MAPLKHHKIRVIDFSVENLNLGSSAWMKTCDEVVRALEEHGCFIASYDRVSQEVHNAAFVASQEVHDLPVEVKVQNTLDAQGYGYVAQEANTPLYIRLSIENATTEQGVEEFAKLMWPSPYDTFSESVLTFTKALADLEQMVMRMVAKSYRIEKDYELLLGRRKGCGDIDKGWGVDSSSSFTFIFHGLSRGCLHGMVKWKNKSTVSQGLQIEIPQEVVDEDHPLQFKAFDHYKYIQYLDTTFDGYRMKGTIGAYCGI
ncbi:hypothetical protein L1987_83934 [Smallanthus sonchifolius]|uniref:Uncharacterized protein n=1 Tax=Smallanthus sonchifolius TaxID=185202 RepID=A0ACB8YDF1_9ASTR|nr:hypothetical protein L1987_83934 [Smallanthus sonchifolius]